MNDPVTEAFKMFVQVRYVDDLSPEAKEALEPSYVEFESSCGCHKFRGYRVPDGFTFPADHAMSRYPQVVMYQPVGLCSCEVEALANALDSAVRNSNGAFTSAEFETKDGKTYLLGEL